MKPKSKTPKETAHSVGSPSSISKEDIIGLLQGYIGILVLTIIMIWEFS